MSVSTLASAVDETADEPIISRSDRLAAIAFLLDDTTETALRGGLAEQLSNIQIRRGGIKAAVRALKSEPSPRVLLVDVSGLEDDPVRALDDLATVCSPDIKVIVLGDRADIEFYRLVTRRLGVDEYLRKPLTRDAVSSLIGPYIAGAEPEQDRHRGGRIVAVCGARGGVGATTIAVNLALQLAEESRSHVALLDLHLRGGHAAMLLGAQPGSGLRAALEDPEHVDGLLLDRVAIAVGDRLRVIAADESIDSDPTPTSAGVIRVLKLLRQRFNIIVIDMPMPPSSAEREALLLARQALVVFNPEVASLRDAQQAKRMITAQIGAGRIVSIMNKSNMQGALSATMIEEGLGEKPGLSIPFFGKQIMHAANLGQPAIRECGGLSRALLPLTQDITGIAQQSASSWTKRLLRLR